MTPPADGTAPPPEGPAGPDEVGPDAVPDTPDPPDGAGLIPDDRAADRIPGGPADIFTN
ncbi:hypothetical protein ACWD0Z_21955 [Streptomyces sp. NPDC003007]